MNPYDYLHIGDWMIGRLAERLGTNQWRVESPSLPFGWTGELKSLSNKELEDGGEEGLWVHAINHKALKILLSSSMIGRYPISDKMRVRYLRTLRAILSIMQGSVSVADYDPQDVSELKGMINRCIRKDQADWLSVYEAFGRPGWDTLTAISDVLANLTISVRRRELDDSSCFIRELQALHFAAVVEQAINHLIASAPRLLDGTRPYSPTERKPTEQSVRESEPHDAKEKPYILRQETLEKREIANQTHKWTLDILVKEIERFGYIVEFGRLIDAYARLRSGSAIFEVKSIIGENELEQCRGALSQLYEYRYRHHLKHATLWLVLSDEPKLSWLIEYLRHDRGVDVLWVANERITGPGFESLRKACQLKSDQQLTSPAHAVTP